MKQLTLFFFCCLIAYAPIALQAQDSNGSSYYGNASPVCDQMSYYEDRDIEQLITAMLQKVGTKPNFAVVQCPGINNCQAVVRGGVPYIVYDAKFFAGIKGLNFTAAQLPINAQDWTTLSILAHEIGHHYNQHLTNRLVISSKTPVDMELEADEFSGFMLYLLGATLPQAQTALQSPMVSEQGSYTHPARSKRLDAIAKGWNNARQMYATTADNDNDGLANNIDKCPNEKGPARNDGCPEAKTATTTTNIIPPPSPKPEVRKDLPNLPEVVFVRGGTFTMGDVMGDNEETDETPHEVTVSDFYMGKYEVTFEEYDLFCEATGREKPGDAGWGRGKRPVINVSWEDATAYCEWASRISGKTYRLPTEAEWEYAAREGVKKVRFGNGKDIIDPTEINFNGSESYKKTYSRTGTYRGQTVTTGSFADNSLRLHDMSGNVWEWCRDWYAADYYGRSPSRDPENTSVAKNRVLRGGSWRYDPTFCRVANREYSTPSTQYYAYGFRVVLAP